MNISQVLCNFFISLIKRSLSIPSREVTLFFCLDTWGIPIIRIVNTGSFPITVLRIEVESKKKTYILAEWKNLFLKVGEKKDVVLNLQEKIFRELDSLYVVSADNKKFFLTKKELSQIKK